jgi:hypothetical protein
MRLHLIFIISLTSITKLYSQEPSFSEKKALLDSVKNRNTLPKSFLYDSNFNCIDLDSIINKPTIIDYWSAW